MTTAVRDREFVDGICNELRGGLFLLLRRRSSCRKDKLGSNCPRGRSLVSPPLPYLPDIFCSASLISLFTLCICFCFAFTKKVTKKKSRVFFSLSFPLFFPAPGPRALRAYDDVTTNLRFSVSCFSRRICHLPTCMFCFSPVVPTVFLFGPLAGRLTPLDGRDMAMLLSPFGVYSNPIFARVATPRCHSFSLSRSPFSACFFFSRFDMICLIFEHRMATPTQSGRLVLGRGGPDT